MAGAMDAVLAAEVSAAGGLGSLPCATLDPPRIRERLAERGVDAVIAQGAEAGGHRGMFLTADVSAQPGLFALLPQVVDAVRVPVIAAGGIGDARGIVAAFALGASAVQLGTAYLFCPEATLSAAHRAALARGGAHARAGGRGDGTAARARGGNRELTRRRGYEGGVNGGASADE